jgi:hypothetical protein
LGERKKAVANNADGVMSDLVSYNLRPKDLPEENAATFAAILEISGKSIKTLFNGFSLLKLPPEIQAAIRAGTFPVSQAYLFAANLDCPDRVKAVNEKLLLTGIKSDTGG